MPDTPEGILHGAKWGKTDNYLHQSRERQPHSQYHQRHPEMAFESAIGFVIRLSLAATINLNECVCQW
ncbi:MAG: hypothetical protein IPH08_11010 [Rhodocyclaceae bacterium]|nr:hypothetical protein [Rhodocyclaceae bacterium]